MLKLIFSPSVNFPIKSDVCARYSNISQHQEGGPDTEMKMDSQILLNMLLHQNKGVLARLNVRTDVVITGVF